MRCIQAAIVLSCVGIIAASPGVSQELTLRQPESPDRESPDRLAFEYGNYYAEPDQQEASPSDRTDSQPAVPLARPVLPPQDLEGATGESNHGDQQPCTSCENGCSSCNSHGRCRGRLCCCEDDPWRLFGGWNEANPWGLYATGWIDAGVTVNDLDPPSDFNGVVTFNDRQDGQLNQFYLTLGRALQDDFCGWQWGGKVDLLFGTDSRFTEARGLETTTAGAPQWNGSPFYGLAMPQAYLEVGYNDLSVKMGHYYTIVGYETVTAPDNFFYSHAYTMQYGEPFTHTGMLATYRWNDNVNLMAGFDRGWDNFEDDPADTLSFLGGVTMGMPGDWDLAFTGTLGQEPSGIPGANDDRVLYSLVARKELTDRLSVVIQHDNGFQDRGAGAAQDAEWYGINSYLFYKFNCCWTGGLRFEWFRDDDGTRVGGIGSRTTGHPLGNTAFIGDFYELTLGANWSPNANLTVRPEIRFDWFEGVTNNANAGPFNEGGSTDQTMAAVDVIYRF